MEQRISPFVFLMSLLVAVGTLLSLTVTTPHDRYHRYQRHDSGTTRKADWIYERLHFDATPIDVALIGTSRMGAGLSAPLIEATYCAATGRRIHVANLSIPETGRNLHYALAKEALRAKSPSLLIVELNETEPRKPHDGFIFLADASDILTAPVLINFNYVSDFLRLPGRQAQLFFEGVMRKPAVRASFDPNAYQGVHLDRTETMTMIDGRVISKDRIVPATRLNAELAKRQSTQKAPYVLPKPLRPFEYRFSRIYLSKITQLATSKDAAVDYVYLPGYKASGQLPDYLYEALKISDKPMNASAGLRVNSALWFDATHVNADGARLQSEIFAQSLATRHSGLGKIGACSD